MKTELSRREFLESSALALGLSTLSTLGSGCPNNTPSNLVYITIDDGPGYYMEEMLDLFEQTGDKATFFVLGQNCEDNYGYEMLIRALNEGHLIGNHSYSHPNFKEISPEEAQAQLLATHEIIQSAYDKLDIFNPKLFRYPFGAEAHQEVISNKGYEVVRWNADTKDYEIGNTLTVDDVKERCLGINPGDIVLTHDLEMTAREIIPFILESYSSSIVR